MQNTTISLIAATFVIGLTHALMPHHWMPFALIGKGQKWNLTKTIFITSLAGLSHSIATCILGFLVALLGFQITSHAKLIAEPLAGILLTFIGIAFIISGRLKSTHRNSHNHSKLTDKAAVVSLLLMLCTSPCIAALPIFLAASTLSWHVFLVLSVVLSVTTTSGMLGLTVLVYMGVKKINLYMVEQYEKEIIGGVLVFIGLLVMIIH